MKNVFQYIHLLTLGLVCAGAWQPAYGAALFPGHGSHTATLIAPVHFNQLQLGVQLMPGLSKLKMKFKEIDEFTERGTEKYTVNPNVSFDVLLYGGYRINRYVALQAGAFRGKEQGYKVHDGEELQEFSYFFQGWGGIARVVIYDSAIYYSLGLKGQHIFSAVYNASFAGKEDIKKYFRYPVMSILVGIGYQFEKGLTLGGELEISFVNFKDLKNEERGEVIKAQSLAAPMCTAILGYDFGALIQRRK